MTTRDVFLTASGNKAHIVDASVLYQPTRRRRSLCGMAWGVPLPDGSDKTAPLCAVCLRISQRSDDLVQVRHDDLRTIYNAAIKADAAGLLGECQSDPCPSCGALEAVSIILDRT